MTTSTAILERSALPASPLDTLTRDLARAITVTSDRSALARDRTRRRAHLPVRRALIIVLSLLRDR